VAERELQRDRLRDRQIARRRARVRRLHADGKSGRQIADLLDVGLATVQRDLRALAQLQMLSEPERDERGRFVRGGPMAGAEPGNFRSLRHGAKSKRLVEPRARELVPGIFAANPHLDQARHGPAVFRYAVNLARIERVYAWLAEQEDEVFLDLHSGEPHGVYRELAQWENGASRAEEQLAIAPLTRARLGLDLQRAQHTAEHREAARSARQRLDRRAADVVDGTASEGSQEDDQ
jgi:hypothetical protein